MLGEFDIYTVTELTSEIKHLVSSRFKDVLVEGEISNFRLYPSGHLYFTIKDESAMIRAVMFNASGRYRKELVGDGVAVICRGRVDVYERRGEYQLIVSAIEARGLGLLQLKFQILKEKLFKEGLFDADKKKPLPVLPQRIGIITSPAGAAVQDMLKVIFGKFENISVLIYPVRVQGDEACHEIVEGLKYFNAAKGVDVIIVGRGGGSLEDLAPFNEEVVARAVYASHIPVVSGVGHEIDFTITDFVADARAPTPTAAADLAVRAKSEFTDLIEGMRNSLEQAMGKKLERSRFALYELAMALKEQKNIFVSQKIYIDELLNNLIHCFFAYTKDRTVQVETFAQRLKDLNPESVLQRGYSITLKKDTGEVVVRVSQVAPEESLTVRLHEGQLDVSVIETTA
ncbi:MAG: Exodeoxyribonuclease 7 large subunit [Syntrophorhabdus sp. PtaU1.Bin153]|nr:MAG: Exodeoxyribonuclease 7 large subunit [Syntrophorhabdus sp. PtaU1.Bin153]